jgi:hypothetical protein
MNIVNILFISLCLLGLSCTKSKTIDTEKPRIDISFFDAFPKNCDTIYFNEPCTLSISLTDNVELGSYTVTIHDNFNHHTHSTEVNECELSEKKQAQNSYLLIQDYSIPKGLQAYTSNIVLHIPQGNNTGAFDEGDYHFFISLTDKEGWSTQKGLSIKLIHRK